jgi:hypothetical protein
MALAVLLSGVGWKEQSRAADNPKEEKKAPPAEQPAKNPAPPAVDPNDPFERMLEMQLKQLENLPEEFREQAKKAIEEMRKHMKENRGRFGGGIRVMPFLPGRAGNPFGAFADRHNARLGAGVERPSSVLVEQLDLPKDQGLVLDNVLASSAAAKAGLKTNDILLELNGKAVPSDLEAFRKLLAEIKPDAPVDAVVLRKGKRESVKGMTLPEVKEDAPGLGGFPNFPNLPANLIPPVPPLPAAPPIARIGQGNFMTTTVNNDHFTIRKGGAGMFINVSGTLVDGKPEVKSVQISDGGQITNADSLDKVPEKYRDQVKELLKSVVIEKK